MKKIISIFTAALTLALCGCSDSKINDSPAPEQPTEPAEPVFAEYTEEDFTPIKMNLNITDNPPPFEIHSVDLSELDFGERLSPCKAEDVREEYIFGHQTFDDPEKQAEYDAEREHLYNTPSKGRIVNGAFLDGKFYFSVNFDDLCGRHDSSVFSFDPRTSELNEINTRTGLEYSDGYRNFVSAGGRLIFMEQGDDSFTVCNIDPTSGEISELFTKNEDILMMQPSDDGILISSIEGKGDTSKYVVKKYDIETGECLGSVDDTDTSIVYGALTCGGELASSTGGSDGEPLSVKTAYYSLDTELKKCLSVYLWEDKASVIGDGSVNGYSSERRLYTYDFDKMERTELNVNGFSQALNMAGDGFVSISQLTAISGNSETAYYIAPQLGTAFRLLKADWISYTASGGVYSFLTSKYEKTESDYMGYHLTSYDYIPEKIYWFEVQE